MKAILLAAGLGTRLRPLTDTVPKCLLDIDGVPLLDRWLNALHEAGVDAVLVNTHHLADRVTRYVAARRGPPEVLTVFEPRLLGSAGTLLANREWIEGEECFLACNADNLTDFDLRVLIDAHLAVQPHPIATVALFRAKHPSACGIVECDDEGRIVAFAEKPSHPVSDQANAGMYVFSPKVLDRCATGDRPLDIGYHLLPHLLGEARTTQIGGFFLDIGTFEDYRAAQTTWPARGAA